ncbi:MAG: carboxypeptidase-like regulatory domain-containing protein [Bryobacteraceae bacterium]
MVKLFSSWLVPAVLLTLCLPATAQEPTGNIIGAVSDPSGATVPRATVTAKDQRTGRSYSVQTLENGSFTFPALAAGEYGLRIEAQGFAVYDVPRLIVEIDRTARVAAALVISARDRVDKVDVSSVSEMVETSSTSLGQTVSQQQVVDLPLNGRNFTQLGLLQAGVVPLTNGLAAAGGSIRASQAFAVNGQRPESNNYLLDGARNVNRMDGGFGIRTPIDAIQEFRSLPTPHPRSMVRTAELQSR